MGKLAELIEYLGFGSAPGQLAAIVPENEEHRAHLRDVSQHAIELLSDTRVKMLEQGQATYRWLLASLLTLNAGAIGVIVGSGWFPRDDAEPSIVAFVVGCVLAILTGLGSALGPMFLNGPLVEVTEHAMLNLRAGQISSASRLAGQHLTRRAVKMTACILAIGLSSLTAFCVGVALLM